MQSIIVPFFPCHEYNGHPRFDQMYTFYMLSDNSQSDSLVSSHKFVLHFVHYITPVLFSTFFVSNYRNQHKTQSSLDLRHDIQLVSVWGPLYWGWGLRSMRTKTQLATTVNEYTTHTWNWERNYHTECHSNGCHPCRLLMIHGTPYLTQTPWFATWCDDVVWAIRVVSDDINCRVPRLLASFVVWIWGETDYLPCLWSIAWCRCFTAWTF